MIESKNSIDVTSNPYALTIHNALIPQERWPLVNSPEASTDWVSEKRWLTGIRPIVVTIRA